MLSGHFLFPGNSEAFKKQTVLTLTAFLRQLTTALNIEGKSMCKHLQYSKLPRAIKIRISSGDVSRLISLLTGVNKFFTECWTKTLYALEKQASNF